MLICVGVCIARAGGRERRKGEEDKEKDEDDVIREIKLRGNRTAILWGNLIYSV